MFPIFEKLGGQEEAFKALESHAIRGSWPSRHTLKDWIVRRKSIPPLVAHRFMRVCEERGIDYQLSDFELPPRSN